MAAVRSLLGPDDSAAATVVVITAPRTGDPTYLRTTLGSLSDWLTAHEHAYQELINVVVFTSFEPHADYLHARARYEGERNWFWPTEAASGLASLERQRRDFSSALRLAAATAVCQ